MGKKKTKEEFINDSKIIYGDKYDYSLVEYVNNKTKIKIICPIHGVFEKTPDKHLYGKSGCLKCDNYHTKNINNHKRTVVDRMNVKHNNFYDYSLVEYVNNKTKIKIICPIHGVFEQTPNNHLQGNGCLKCGGTEKMSTQDFINKAKLVHGDKYDYSLVNYVNYKNKVKIICSLHGVFNQSFIKHCNRKNGCPICKESKGEKQIRVFLENNKINFTPQYRFNNCINKYPLPFDFYLPDYNMCIEFNGEQHYKSFKFFGGSEKFKQQLINDNIKLKFCENNKIQLLIIKYDENVINKLKKKYKK